MGIILCLPSGKMRGEPYQKQEVLLHEKPELMVPLEAASHVPRSHLSQWLALGMASTLKKRIKLTARPRHEEDTGNSQSNIAQASHCFGSTSTAFGC